MKKTVLRLDIASSKYLTLEFFGKIKDLYLFDEITITYHENRKKYVLYTKDFVIESLRTLEKMLMAAIDKQIAIHDSIKHDLGYLWSEYLENKTEYNFVEKPLENSTCWVGLDNLLLSSRQYETWLYNKNDNIYLEITPCYKWHHIKPKKNEKHISYNEFIKNYKPIAIVEIDKKIAQKWLKIIIKLTKIAQTNYEKVARQQNLIESK